MGVSRDEALRQIDSVLDAFHDLCEEWLTTNSRSPQQMRTVSIRARAALDRLAPHGPPYARHISLGYGGMRTEQARRLKDLEREDARLKTLLAEAELDKAILREAAAGNF